MGSVKDFGSLARVLEGRDVEPGTRRKVHHVEFQFPSGRVIKNVVHGGVLQFSAGDRIPPTYPSVGDWCAGRIRTEVGKSKIMSYVTLKEVGQ